MRPELFEGDVVVYAPEEEVTFEVVFGCQDLRLHGEEEVFYQLPLLHRLREVVPPPEREPGCYDGARVSDQENDRHSGEVRAHPAEEQVGPYVLDQTPPRDDAPVEAVGPGVPEPAREREAGRLQKFLPLVVWSQVLFGPEVPERADHSRVERFEDVTIPPSVVDDLWEPRCPAPPATRQKDGASVVSFPKVDVETAWQPCERRAYHRTASRLRVPINASAKEERNRRS